MPPIIPDKNNLGQTRVTSQYQAQSYRPIMPDADTGLAEAGRKVTAFATRQLNKKVAEHKDLQRKTLMLETEQRLNDYEEYSLNDPHEGAFTRKGKDAYGLSHAVTKDFDDFSKGLIEGVEDEGLRMMVKMGVEAKRSSMVNKLQRHEAVEMDGYYNGLLTSRIETASGNAATYFNDPERVAEERGTILSSIEHLGQQHGWSPEETEAKMLTGLGAMHSGIVNRLLAIDDISGAANYLNKNADDMDAATLTGLTNKIDQVHSADRSRVRDLLNDQISAMSDGYMPDNLVSEAQIRQTFKEEEAQQLVSAMRDAQEFGQTRSQISTATREERMQMILDQKERVATGVDYRREARQLATLIKLNEEVDKELENDPVGFIQKTQSGVQEAALRLNASFESGDINQIRTATQDYTHNVMAVQERLGVPDRNRRILSVNMAQALVDETRTGNPDKVLKVINSYEARFSPNQMKMVRKELVREGLDRMLFIAAHLKGSGRQRLIQAVMSEEADLNKGLEGGVGADLKAQIISEMKDFTSVMAGYDKSGLEQVNMTHEAVEKLAKYSVSMLKMSPKAAVEYAMKEIVHDHAEYGSTYWVPKDTGLNLSQVEAATEAITGSFIGRNMGTGSIGILEAKDHLDLPYEGTSTAWVGLSETEKRTRFAEDIANNGEWKNANDGSGLILHSRGFVVTMDGQPVRMTWDSIKKSMDTMREEAVAASVQQQKEAAANSWRPKSPTTGEPLTTDNAIHRAGDWVADKTGQAIAGYFRTFVDVPKAILGNAADSIEVGEVQNGPVIKHNVKNLLGLKEKASDEEVFDNLQGQDVTR